MNDCDGPNRHHIKNEDVKTSIFFCTLSIVQVWTGDVGVHNKSIKMYSVFPDPRLSYDGYRWGAFFVF